MFVLSKDAFVSIKTYIEVQVINSLNNIVTVDSRFFIIKRLFSELLVIVLLLIILYISTRKKQVKFIAKDVKFFLFLFTFSLTGVLPILVSMKQSGYYILTVYPILSISFVVLFKNHLLILHEYLRINTYTKVVSILFFVTGVISSLLNINYYSRDEQVIKDINKINSFVQKGETICGASDLTTQYSIIGYFYRLIYVSVSFNSECNSRILIITNNSILNKSQIENYIKLNIGTKELLIYKLNSGIKKYN